MPEPGESLLWHPSVLRNNAVVPGEMPLKNSFVEITARDRERTAPYPAFALSAYFFVFFAVKIAYVSEKFI